MSRSLSSYRVSRLTWIDLLVKIKVKEPCIESTSLVPRTLGSTASTRHLYLLRCYSKITSDAEEFVPRPFKVRSALGNTGLPFSERGSRSSPGLNLTSLSNSRQLNSSLPSDVSSTFSARSSTQTSGLLNDITPGSNDLGTEARQDNKIVANHDPEVLRVFVIRHGQTNENVQKILQGHLDTSLNQTGVEQAQKVAIALRGIPFENFVSSDLQRCKQTLQYIQLFHPDIPTRYSTNLRERDMGECQGMYLTDALAKYGTNFRNIGEAKADFIDRIEKEWNRLIQHNPSSRNVAICTHGGVVTGFLNHLYQCGYGLLDLLREENLKVPFNTLIAVVDINRTLGKGVIQTFGNTDHLGAQFEVKEQLLR